MKQVQEFVYVGGPVAGRKMRLAHDGGSRPLIRHPVKHGGVDLGYYDEVAGSLELRWHPAASTVEAPDADA